MQSAVAPYVADDCLVAVADGPRAEALAREWGLALDESSTRRALLVSPHAAAAALFGVDASRAPDVGRRKRDLLALMTHLEELDAATPRLRVNRNITWVELRKRVEADLSLRGLPREKVLAAVVRLMELTLIRVGNDEYAKQNKSFGLTTLRDKHVKFKGDGAFFEFRGKSGKVHQTGIRDRRLARIVRACQDVPGQRLFQYYDDEGQRHAVHSNDVNQ